MDDDIIFAPPENKLKLTAYIFKYPKLFLIQAAWGIVYNTIIVFGSIFLGKAIDAANLVHNGEAHVSLFYLYLFAFLGDTVLFQTARLYKRIYMRAIVNFMRCDIRAGLLSSVFAMPMSELSKVKVGDMMSRMIGDVEQVSQSMQITITEIWDTVLLMLSYLATCCFYSPRITLLSVIPIPIAILAAQLLRHPLYIFSQKSRDAASKINVHLQHNVSGIALLRLFGLEDADMKSFSQLLDEQLKWNVAAEALQNGMLPLYTLIACSGLIFVFGMGGEYVVGGKWTIGVFTAFLSMFTAMAVRTNVAAAVMNTWHGAKASWDRICEKMSSGSDGDDKEIQHSHREISEYALDVRSLSFRYTFSGEAYLHDISFTAKKGEIIGITGSVGSGKSALAAALSGLYAYGGEVILNGEHLHSMRDRHKKIALMDSEHFVFSDDVEFNITLDRPGGDLNDAVTLAALEQDINEFDNGIHTKLMECGISVSGGQRQRIALARAWYGQPDLLILDDPFSAVDINMEKKIMANIRERLNDATVLLLSNRLSAFDMTDKIIVLDNGEIGQMGTHDELLIQDGLYRDIYTAQTFMRGGWYETQRL